MSIELAEAGPAHAELVAALHAASVAEGEGDWSGDWVARILALPGAFAVLALAPEPVGFALCLPAGEAVDLAAVGVVPEQRRRGVGRRLLAHCVDRAKASGAARLMLEVAADNAAALAFYRAAGFEPAGRRAGYYPARGGAPRDALVLSKTL